MEQSSEPSHNGHTAATLDKKHSPTTQIAIEGEVKTTQASEPESPSTEDFKNTDSKSAHHKKKVPKSVMLAMVGARSGN